MVMPWVYYILLLALLVMGLFINILGLPGLWLMLLGVVIYGWLTNFLIIGWWGIASIFLLCVVGEIVEFIFGGVGAKKAGASGRAVLGAIIGGLLGGIFLTFIPIPIISTIVGVCLGSFIGAMVMEYSHAGEMEKSLRVGVGAAKGRFWGMMSKSLVGVIILLTSLILTFPLRAKIVGTVAPAAGIAKPQATSVPSATSMPATTRDTE